LVQALRPGSGGRWRSVSPWNFWQDRVRQIGARQDDPVGVFTVSQDGASSRRPAGRILKGCSERRA
jgi:hypothetical protein